MSSSSTDAINDTFTWNGYLPATDTVTLGSTAIGKVTSNWNNYLTLSSSVITDATNTSYTASYSYDNDAILETAGDETLTPDTTTGLLDSTTLGALSDSYSYNSSYAELASYTAAYTPSGGSPSTLLSETYTTRDALGRISAKSETNNGTTHTYAYTYDAAGRLATVTRDGSAYSSYSYDSNSNRATGSTVAGASVTASYDAQDRLSSYNTLTFGYDLNGQRTSMTDSSTSQTTSYTWDELGNLKSVTLPSSTVISYLVDASGRRVVRKSGSTVTAQYLYRDNLKLEAVLDSSGTMVQRFVYGSKPNVPDYMVMSGTDYRIFSDERGSVRLVVNSSDGTILEQMDYDEFGNVINDTSPGAQPFGFAGCLYDSATKLCHFGAREYDPSTGRWLSKDPLIFGGGDTNLYGYVLTDPINHIDPSGLLFQDLISQILTPQQQLVFGGIIGAIGGYAIRTAISAPEAGLGAVGAGLFGLFLINEGYQNSATAITRLGVDVPQWSPSSNSSPLNPFQPNQPPMACR